MRVIQRPRFVCPTLLAATVAATLLPLAVQAAEVKLPEVSVGAGMRASYTSLENGAGEGERSNDFNLDSVRLFVSGSVTDTIKFNFNTDYDGSDEKVKVMDALGRFEYSDTMNIWVGRFLPPTDRSNLSGPYYLSTWTFPVVQGYPAIFAGRDDGVAYWGQVGGGSFKWQAGVFEGVEQPEGESDELLYAGRLTLNLWDPESGYYNSSTYYGEKEVLAFGLVGQSQDGDSAYSLDALMETNVGPGVITLEGAYYMYDGLGGLGGDKSDGYFVLGGYLFQPTGPGRFQPTVRYASGSVDKGPEGEVIDYNLNYILKGHSARISATYQTRSDALYGEDDAFILGVQLQM